VAPVGSADGGDARARAPTLAPRLITYEAAAEYLGIPIGTLRSMVCRKQIPYVRLSARVVRFELAVLDAVIEERRVDAERRIGLGGAL
jgi:excisionase family DNA binding protein